MRCAEDDEGAKKEAEFYKDYLRLVEDNNADVVSIHETPYGTIGQARKIK